MKCASKSPPATSKARPKILFGLSSTYLPGTVTGANVGLDALCRRLIEAGYDPVVVCARDAAAAPPADAPAPPYPVLRLADPVAALAEMIVHLAPQAVVMRGLNFAARAAKFRPVRDFPACVKLVTSVAGQGLPAPADVPHWRYAANSPFVVNQARAYLGVPVALVPSLVEPSAYYCKPSGEAVLFVNPVADKGVHIAAAIARRLRRRRFVFARSWPEHADYPHQDVTLPNVEWAETVHDMRPLYARARLLLVPSVWEESSARVVTEAQASGIPVVASDRGGLADNVGRGGIVLSLAEPIGRWCAAVESLFTDAARHAALSRLARKHAHRPEIAPEEVLRRFLRFVAR